MPKLFLNNSYDFLQMFESQNINATWYCNHAHWQYLLDFNHPFRQRRTCL